jgi:hypothetical protein
MDNELNKEKKDKKDKKTEKNVEKTEKNDKNEKNDKKEKKNPKTGKEEKPEKPEKQENQKDDKISNAGKQEENKDKEKISHVKCSHIMLKYNGCNLNRDLVRDKNINRSEEDANKELNIIREKLLKEGVNSFGNYAKEFSECLFSADKLGDLGCFGKGDTHSEIEEVCFNKIKVGEVSNVIKTESGLHILLRTE